MRKCRIGTAKFFTLLLLLYRTLAKIDGMKPGTLSWNAKNVMPFIAEEDLFQRDNVILIAQEKSKEPCLVAFKDANKVSEFHIPGLYDLWIRERA